MSVGLNMQIGMRPYGQSVLTQPQSFQVAFDLRKRIFALSFTALWLLILSVAVVDGYFMLINRQIMFETELNPVGRFLLSLDDGNIRYFFVAKCCGTIAASSVLLVLYWTHMRIGFAVTMCLALFQLGLLRFLLFGP
jgi:hypothetical protein